MIELQKREIIISLRHNSILNLHNRKNKCYAWSQNDTAWVWHSSIHIKNTIKERNKTNVYTFLFISDTSKTYIRRKTSRDGVCRGYTRNSRDKSKPTLPRFRYATTRR